MSSVSRRLGVATAAAILALSSLGVAAVVAANDYGASCTFGPSSVAGEFTGSGRTATYYWVWRTGYSVIDYGYARVADGADASDTGTWSGTSLTDGSIVKFGVVKGGSMKYSYVTCTWAP